MEQEDLVTGATDLPVTINPFLVAAKLIEHLMMIPRRPKWSQILRDFTLSAFGIMFLQAVFLQFQRFQIITSYKPKYNKLGLLLINVSDLSTFAYSLYSLLTVALLSLHIVLDHGAKDQSVITLLFGLKFLPLIAGSWGFFWVCACQCALLAWDSNAFSKLNRKKVQVSIKWGMNVFILCAAFGPFPAIIWSYAVAFIKSRRISALIAQAHASLLIAASTYNPNNYDENALKDIKIPEEKLKEYTHQLESCILTGITVYSCALTSLAVICIPSLVFSLKGLYKNSVSESSLDGAVGRQGRLKPSAVGRRVHQTRRRLIYHALAVYCSTCIHLPIMYWQLLNSPPGFTTSSKWQELTYHGLAIPFSITGNMALLILNLHSRASIREFQVKRARLSACASINSHTGPSHVCKDKEGPAKACIAADRDMIIDVELGCSVEHEICPEEPHNSMGRNHSSDSRQSRQAPFEEDFSGSNCLSNQAK